MRPKELAALRRMQAQQATHVAIMGRVAAAARQGTVAAQQWGAAMARNLRK